MSHLKILSEICGGAQIYANREDLNHTGAHKLNPCMAGALLARHMGKIRLIAETGAGQNGEALATAAACLAWNAKSIWARSTSKKKRLM